MNEFSIFEAPITAKNNLIPSGKYTLPGVLEYLKSGEAKSITQAYRALPPDKQQKQKKLLFRAATFAGTFSHRAAAGLQSESGLICIDIDHVPAQGWGLKDLEGFIKNDPNLAVRLMFVSPSGDGLKIVAERPSGIPHRDYYTALELYFSEAYRIAIDKSGSNIDRLCFLPYDPEAYYADKASLDPQTLRKWQSTYGRPQESRSQRRAQAQDAEDKTGVAGAFCRCYTIQEAIAAFLPDVYTRAGSPFRYTYAQGHSYGGLVVYEDGQHAYSHHGTDPAGGRACSAFDLVRIHKFGADEGGPGSDSYKQMTAFAAEDPKVKKYLAELDFRELASTPGGRAEDLQALLDRLKKINFRKKAEEYGLPPETGKMGLKVELATTIRELCKQLEALGSGLMYCDGWPYVYISGYWRRLQQIEMASFLTSAAIALGTPPVHAEYFERREQLYKQFASQCARIAPARNRSKSLINLRNGTLEVDGNTGAVTLREPRRNDLLRYQLPYDYDPGAGCPLFHKYLDRVLPDETAQAVASEYLGNALAPALNLQKALVLLGSGDNGKSVFFDIVSAVLGRDNVSNFDLEDLTKSNREGRFELAGKMLNYCSESSTRINATAFKTLVRNEPISARRQFQDATIIENYARLMFNCNILPKEVEQTEGYYRSFLIIPFSEKISEAERIPNLAEMIITSGELPGIFNWILEGLKRLLKARRYTDCESSRKALAEYRTNSSSVLLFLEEFEIKATLPGTKKVLLDSLYKHYTSYCIDSGYKGAFSKNNFSKTLIQLGFQKDRTKAGMVIYCDYSPDFK